MVVIFAAGWLQPGSVDAAKAGAGQANLLRAVFFGLCFFSIGLVTNVRKLWKSGLGRVIGVYAVALVGFIIWVGLFISYIFYHALFRRHYNFIIERIDCYGIANHFCRIAG